MPSHGDAERVLMLRGAVQQAMLEGAYDIKREIALATEYGVSTRIIRWHRSKLEKKAAAKLKSETADEQEADLLARVRYAQRLAIASCTDKDGVTRPTDLKAAASLLHTEARILGQLRDRVEVEHSGTVNLDVRAMVQHEIRALTDDQLDTACERIATRETPALEVYEAEAK